MKRKNTVKLTEDSFRNGEIDFDETIVVNFKSDSCMPCKKMEIILDKISTEENIFVGDLNVDVARKVVETFDIINIPTLLIFRNRLPKGRVIGLKPKEEIYNILGI